MARKAQIAPAASPPSDALPFVAGRARRAYSTPATSESPIPPTANNPLIAGLVCPATTMATWSSVPTSEAMNNERVDIVVSGGSGWWAVEPPRSGARQEEIHVRAEHRDGGVEVVEGSMGSGEHHASLHRG